MSLMWLDDITEPQRPRQPKLPCTCNDPSCRNAHDGDEVEEPLTCDQCGDTCDTRYTVEDAGDPSVGYGPETLRVCSACIERKRR